MHDSFIKAHVVGESDDRGRSQQLPEEGWRDSYESGEVKEPPYSLGALAELYEVNPTHKACVDAKAANIVGLGYRFAAVVNGRTRNPVNREYLERLFETSNGEMTFTETMRAIWTDVETVGNGYMEVLRNSQGEIDGFYHVPGTTVRVKMDRGGFAQVQIGRAHV